MPYAVNGKISKKPLDGCIEITDEQYKKAMQAQLAGHQIVVRREGLRILSQENKTIWSTSDKTKKEIPLNEDLPKDYTEVEPGEFDEWDGEKWVVNIDKLKTKKIAELADARWREETAGYIYNSHEFHSDRESQNRIFQAYMASSNNPNFAATWKTKTGWLEMTAKDFIALYNEFQTFLQDLYKKEKTLQGKVRTVTTIKELEALKW